MTTTTTTISSPCIRICFVDGQADICVGCGRTLPEIASWGRKSEAERLAIMATLPQRLRDNGFEPPKPAV
ncbi:MAG: DUF1289 domain-containing protein [Alphaproteobacteria bacterium]|nr:DUF1289 domain-containing protein [Alphaproteobacteria bacterium]